MDCHLEPWCGSEIINFWAHSGPIVRFPAGRYARGNNSLEKEKVALVAGHSLGATGDKVCVQMGVGKLAISYGGGRAEKLRIGGLFQIIAEHFDSYEVELEEMHPKHPCRKLAPELWVAGLRRAKNDKLYLKKSMIRQWSGSREDYLGLIQAELPTFRVRTLAMRLLRKADRDFKKEIARLKPLVLSAVKAWNQAAECAINTTDGLPGVEYWLSSRRLILIDYSPSQYANSPEFAVSGPMDWSNVCFARVRASCEARAIVPTSLMPEKEAVRFFFLRDFRRGRIVVKVAEPGLLSLSDATNLQKTIEQIAREQTGFRACCDAHAEVTRGLRAFIVQMDSSNPDKMRMSVRMDLQTLTRSLRSK